MHIRVVLAYVVYMDVVYGRPLTAQYKFLALDQKTGSQLIAGHLNERQTRSVAQRFCETLRYTRAYEPTHKGFKFSKHSANFLWP